MLVGSGVKTKVLDCLSWGVPVVSTREGVSGVVNIQESGILVYDDTDSFINGILKIINDKSFAQICSEKSFKYYNKYYSQGSVESKYDDAFNNMELI